MVQRKHVLRTLAIEAGFESRENYRCALDDFGMPAPVHCDLLSHISGYPNL